MRQRFAFPRLLPMTIGMIVIVLATKSFWLIRSVVVEGHPAALIAEARASGPEPAAAVRHDAKPPETAEKLPQLQGPPPISDSERAVLLELRQRRQELDARDAALTARESMLTAAEDKLTSRVGQLQALQQKLESLDASHRQQEDVAWLGLVKVYETMKPRDAAAIFNDLGMPVLLAVVGRMKDAKAAAVLAAMVPDRARDVTTQLAQTRTRGAGAVEAGDSAAPSRLSPEPPPPGAAKSPGSGT